jgi:hypothetical protein
MSLMSDLLAPATQRSHPFALLASIAGVLSPAAMALHNRFIDRERVAW